MISEVHLRTKIFFWIILLMGFFTACFSSRRVSIENFYVSSYPPNGVKVPNNLFCDRSEVTNFNWMEYMYWNKKVFGFNSQEHIATLPDTLVWLSVDSCLHQNVNSYLRHPAYRDYPVVGVSQEQAEEFSKWRSDRVLEYHLIMFKVIKYDTAQTKETYFTIEKYFNNELNNIISDKKATHFPEFRLPTLNERELILSYSDSLDKDYVKKCKSKYCKECKVDFPAIWIDISPCKDNSFRIEPTLSVYSNCSAKRKKPFYHLRGNVSEWTAHPNITTGGGWKNSIPLSTTDTVTSSNAWTGFRNVCEWKKWQNN